MVMGFQNRRILAAILLVVVVFGALFFRKSGITSSSRPASDDTPTDIGSLELYEPNLAATDTCLALPVIEKETIAPVEMLISHSTQRSSTSCGDPVFISSTSSVTLDTTSTPKINTLHEDPAAESEPDIIPAAGNLVGDPYDVPSPDSSSGEAAHTHSFELSESVAATCTTDGTRTYICRCGESYSETVPMLEHRWEIASTYEVIDSECYCKFKCAVLTCTSPECIKDGQFVTTFNAKDYGYSYEKLYEAYSSHASMHLAKGQQASYTAKTAWTSESTAMYDQLLSEQNKTPRAVLSLELVPATTHSEHTYRCSICGAEK